MANQPEELSPAARATAIVSQITTIALGMVAPGVVGWLLDQQLGWTPILAIAGFVFGLGFGIWRLRHLVKTSSIKSNSGKTNGGGGRGF